MRKLQSFSTALRPLLDLFWPPRCLACDGAAWDAVPLCRRCVLALPEPGPRCYRCGRLVGPLVTPHACLFCVEEDLRLDGVVAAYAYRGTARALVHALKYRARLPAAACLAQALAEALGERRIPGDLFVPVPLSRRRRRGRGFNQAAVLAHHLASTLGLELDLRALRRRRHTPPQVGLSRRGRLLSPRGAFEASRPRVAGRAVLLVDDVLTTGGTARAAAVALRRAGARSVVAAVACRAEGR